MRHRIEVMQLEANLERAKNSVSTLNKINGGFSRQVGENADATEAFKAALDEASPGWRDANGSYKTVGKRIVLPKSQAPAPNPPKK